VDGNFFYLDQIFYTVILFSAKMVEIRLKTVEYAQFNFRHRFWPNFFQFDRNSTHDWFFVRRFGLNSASLGKFPPILALVTVFNRISAILAENKITV
jgi:hypothetical protein